MAAKHLLSRGYRDLAFCGDEAHLASRIRLRGFALEAKAGGAQKIKVISISRADGVLSHSQALTRWLRSLPKPVGIFGFTDQMAIEIAEACGSAEIRVPQEAAILGVGNDLTRLDFAHVDVSSIQLNTQRIGQLAGELLLSSLNRRRVAVRPLLLPPVKIATRKSTDLFAVDDDAVAQALDHIRENVGNTVYVESVARAAGVSRRLLEMKFRKQLNTSVYAEVQRAHFEHAIELMSDPELTISEVAFASGFDSAQRFSTAFRRKFGQAPIDYRDIIRNGRAGSDMKTTNRVRT